MKLLMLENHPHFAHTVIKEFLSEYDVDVIPSIHKAKKAVTKTLYDLVLSDFDLDDGKGDEFVKFLKEREINIPVIAISSHQEGNNKLIKAGATAICSKMHFRKIQSIISSIGV